MQTFNYNLKALDFKELKKFRKEKNILIQIFCGQGKEILKKSIKKLLKKLPQAICIGTTTDGEIENKTITTNNTIISLSIFNNTQIESSFIKGKDSFENGFNLAKNLVKKNTKLLILFTDGSKTNGENFLKGIENFDKSVVICGGMAGDNGKFTQTYISCQNKILKNGAVGVSLNSDILQVYNDYKFNWSPIGIEHKIEKIKNNRVYSISGMTPVEFYSKYLGKDIAQALPATGIEFPLIVEKKGVPIARAIIAKHKDGSASFAGNLQERDKVKLGFGNAEMIMQSPIETLYGLTDMKAQSFFLYSCMARRRYMPNFIQVEVIPFSKITSTSGFFSYAEFYHDTKKKTNQLLNQTLTVVALSESNENLLECHIQKKEKNKKNSEHARTIQALTHLIHQSTRDYDEQREKLNKEKEYSHNLLASQKQFLRHTVHETNTPLSVIMANVELFEMEFEKNKYTSNIEVAMKNLFSIYDDLSYLVKKDQIEYRKQKIELVDYIRSRIDFFSQVAIKSKTKLFLNSTENSKYIFFNETKLQRIIDNNITNAIKYSFENNDILISILESNEFIILKFISHSNFIQDPKKIFEEYYREEKLIEGFGLGLNLVKKICDEENIKIKLESNKNKTTFTYTFKRFN